jgi:hypothetical protein
MDDLLYSRWREKYYDKTQELRLCEDKLILALEALTKIQNMNPNNSNVEKASAMAQVALEKLSKGLFPR